MQVKVVKRKEFNKLDKDFLSRSRNFLQKVNVEKETKARVAVQEKGRKKGLGHARNARGERVAHPRFSFSLPLSNAFHAASKETLAKFKVSLYASSMLVTNWRWHKGLLCSFSPAGEFEKGRKRVLATPIVLCQYNQMFQDVKFLSFFSCSAFSGDENNNCTTKTE